jgi:hypothetical protein
MEHVSSIIESMLDRPELYPTLGLIIIVKAGAIIVKLPGRNAR